MKILLLKILAAIVIFATTSTIVNAGGISVDAGLTPPEDRWILRNQVRHWLSSGSDQANLLLFKYYHSKNRRFEVLSLHFHAPK